MFKTDLFNSFTGILKENKMYSNYYWAYFWSEFSILYNNKSNRLIKNHHIRNTEVTVKDKLSYYQHEENYWNSNLIYNDF